MAIGQMGATGKVSIKKIEAPKNLELSVHDGSMHLRDILHYAYPRDDKSQTDEMKAWKRSNIPNINRGLSKIAKAIEWEIPTFYGMLWAKHIDKNGEEVDYGLVSLRVVTKVGVESIVDAFTAAYNLGNLKYHALGTGTNAEAYTDTALQTELGDKYNPDNTRATGTTVDGDFTYEYRTVGTNTLVGGSGYPAQITEHGILSQAATGGGQLLDRSVFSVINLSENDSLQTTYDLLFNHSG